MYGVGWCMPVWGSEADLGIFPNCSPLFRGIIFCGI